MGLVHLKISVNELEKMHADKIAHRVRVVQSGHNPSRKAL